MAATLTDIRTKVRRLTRSLSESQLSTAQIDDYINTFVLYDLPEHLRLFNLKKTFTFYAQPYIDTYTTNTTDDTNPLYQFKDKYITVHEPVYISGQRAWFVEDKAMFFGSYPLMKKLGSTGHTGDGVVHEFTGTLPNSPSAAATGPKTLFLRNHVVFSSIAASGDGIIMIDYPITPLFGNLYKPGGSPTSSVAKDPNNYVDYTTGKYVLDFGALNIPAASTAINSQVIQLQPAMPTAVLFYDDTFTLRPVPDQPYSVQMDVFVRPTKLEAADQIPELQEWSQYIAYGAARKVFQDRMDIDSLTMIEPEYKKQEILIQRRTIVQQTSQRVQTIYTNHKDESGGWFDSGNTF